MHKSIFLSCLKHLSLDSNSQPYVRINEGVIYNSFMVITQIVHICPLRDPYSFEGNMSRFQKNVFLRIAISIFDADWDRDRDLNFGGRAHAMMKGESISPNFK